MTVVRVSHPGRTAAKPYTAGALASAQAAAERALPDTVTLLSPDGYTTDLDPPYEQTPVFTTVDTGIPALLELDYDWRTPVVDEETAMARWDLRVPHGTALEVGQVVEPTASQAGLVGKRFELLAVHDSSTEPLLRATVRRYQQEG